MISRSKQVVTLFFISEIAVVLLLINTIEMLSYRGVRIAFLIFFVALGPLVSFSSVVKMNSWNYRTDWFAPWFFFPIIYGMYYGIGILGDTSFDILISPFFFGLLVYYLGIIFSIILFPVKNNSKQGLSIKWNYKVIYQATVIIYSISLLALSVIFLRVGFIGFTSNVETGRVTVISNVGGYLYYLGLLSVIAFILSTFYFMRVRNNYIRKLVLASLSFISLLLLSMLGYRAWVVIPLLVAYVLVFYFNRKLGSSMAFLVLPLTFIYLFLYGAYRKTGGALQFTAVIELILHEAKLGPSSLYLVFNYVPSIFPFLNGSALLMPLVSILPGSNPLLGNLLKDKLNLHFAGGGFGSTLLGGLYIDFGYSGIWIGMFLIGFLYASLYKRVIQFRDEFSLAVYAFMSIYLLNSLRISFLSDSFLPYMVIGTLWVINSLNYFRK